MSSPMQTMVQETLIEQVREANGLVEKLSDKANNPQSQAHEIRTNSETQDEKVKAFQAWFEKANASINAQVAEIDKYILESLVVTSSNFDPEAAKVRYSEIKKAYSSARTFLSTNVPDFDEEAFAAEVPELKSLRGGAVGKAGAGTGPKRPRLENVWVNDELIKATVKNSKGETSEVSSFTATAAYLSKASGVKVEVSELSAACFEAAKTDDLNQLAGQMIEFHYLVGDPESGKNYAIRVQPRTTEA